MLVPRVAKERIAHQFFGIIINKELNFHVYSAIQIGIQIVTLQIVFLTYKAVHVFGFDIFLVIYGNIIKLIESPTYKSWKCIWHTLIFSYFCSAKTTTKKTKGFVFLENLGSVTVQLVSYCNSFWFSVRQFLCRFVSSWYAHHKWIWV